LTGDYGGHTYVIREASAVAAPEDALRQLAVDLDAMFALHADATDVQWGIVNPWQEWGGSPPLAQGFWINPRLVAKGVDPASVELVLAGAVPRLPRAR
jgi:hypothetical protein